MKPYKHPAYSVPYPVAVMDENQPGLSTGLADPQGFSESAKVEDGIQKNIRVDGALYMQNDLHEGGKYRFGDGSQTSPAIAFKGSPGTGLRRSAADVIKIPIAGTDVVTIDSTGIHPVSPTAIGPMTSDRILGRDTAGSGDAEQLTVGGNLEFTGSGGIQRGALTGDVTAAAGSGTTDIAADVVTNTELANMAQSTIKGRAVGAGTGDPTDLTSAQATAILDLATTSVKGLAPVLSNVSTEFLNGTGAYSTPASTSDLVYTGTPGDFDVSEVTDVQIVSRNVTSVGATDQLIVEGYCTILNDSAATRIYTFTIDFDSAFDVEMSTGALSASAADEHPILFKAICTLRATNDARSVHRLDYYTNTASASGADQGVSSATFSVTSWGKTTSDLSSTCTVTLHVRSTNANATQTLRLENFTIRKVTPT